MLRSLHIMKNGSNAYCKIPGHLCTVGMLSVCGVLHPCVLRSGRAETCTHDRVRARLQKSKTKQTIDPQMLRELQEEPNKYTRMFHSPACRYTEPFLALRLLQLQGSDSDAELLHRKEVQPQRGTRVGTDTEMRWASFDAVVWLATCMRELDSHMELTEEILKHPWIQKLSRRVFRCASLAPAAPSPCVCAYVNVNVRAISEQGLDWTTLDNRDRKPRG